MVNQVQVNSLVIGYSFKYTDKIKCLGGLDLAIFRVLGVRQNIHLNK